jgi:hypothetical protein
MLDDPEQLKSSGHRRVGPSFGVRQPSKQLHSRAHDERVFLYVFDLLELDGLDLRPLPLEERKGRLQHLLSKVHRPPGVPAHRKGFKWPELFAEFPVGVAQINPIGDVLWAARQTRSKASLTKPLAK